MTGKRAFSYIRMSTEAQLQGDSLRRQLELTSTYANEKGFELIDGDDLRDIGLSAYDGTNTGKGKLGEFLKGIREGTVDKNCVLLVENLDRLSRQNPMRAFAQFTEIIEYGIEIHTISDRQIYTSKTLQNNQGQLFLSLGQMLRANSESEEKSKRLKGAWKNKRNNLGKHIYTSICPAWLKPNEDKTGFIEIPERVETIKKIFDLYIDDGLGAYSIARYLNLFIEDYPRFTLPEKRHRAKNGKHKTGWQKSYIIKILNNTSVHGEFCPHEMREGKREATKGATVINYFPAIISEDRFLLAQAKKGERSIHGGGRKGKSFNNLFTKLVECKHCGGVVHYINKGDPPKGGKYLRCSNAELGHNCNCATWPYEDFEENFLEFVGEVEFESVLSKVSDKSLKTKLLEEQETNSEKLKRTEKKLDDLLEFETGLTGLALNKAQEKAGKLSVELDRLEKRKREIQIELSGIETRNVKKTQKELIDAIKQQQNTADPVERASIRRRIHSRICLVVEKIVIHNWHGDFLDIEAYDMLSPNVKSMLTTKGYDTEDKVIKLFSNKDGKNLFSELERYFVVHFKNGEERPVHPSLKRSWKYTSDRQGMARLKKVKELREGREARIERDRTSRLIKKKATTKTK